MKTLLALFIIAIILVIPEGSIAQGVPWNGIISVETVNTTPGNKVTIDINLDNNDLAVSGIEIPLQFNNSNIVFDSVSFVGSLKPADISGIYFQSSASKVKITYIPDINTSTIPTITATSGLVGRMYFTVLSSAQPGFYAIDSINQDTIIGSGTHLVTRINVSDSSGNTTYLPIFVPGGILVKVPTGIEDGYDNSLPAEYALAQNYPNPFNPSTEITFALPSASQISIDIFNVLGQKTESLVKGNYPAGTHTVTFDASKYPSGIYFYRLNYDRGNLTKKMVLMK